MTVIAIVADPSNTNAAALKGLLPELEAAGAEILLGNDLASFQASSNLGEVEAVVLAVFAGGSPAVLKELWPLCPKVRWVHSMAAGVDTLAPVMRELPRGTEVPVTNAKGAFSRSLGEYAIAAMLHFNKQVTRLQSNRLEKKWEKFVMSELHGMTVGFVGFGDIAQTTARMCKVFGMKIVANRNSKGSGDELADEVYYSSENPSAVTEVFKKSDFVVCSLPGGEKTYHACGAEQFEAMKSTGIFISMGRGTCVDEVALAKALKSGSIAGAALDVFETEPLPKESPLWECSNTLLSSHNADLTETYMKQTWDIFVAKYKSFVDPSFKGFDDVVDLNKGY
mmetsp:Transcript_10476/g.23062  ORF Transcript_10476/g.23062 Transcript_10476/m.23062 type:complete len:338 (-) Transcript_10476:694-1707(-)|eukprot:CAMPEP_0206464500 /NCGR_PEP_ID=MMETSP0324_2-20121206/27253_1 /ASSEMBLY_ACC=CAM_ASM_000836 /TAXON_ID=2866 /ORGANISM="Crypthecodinium cohnii, Strain Seligo" /LENGTH=337 /DNA_ID=CAMNT_0053937143 /DNA_START=60 /DNA_END=1073 /DNA_ORIENTATION=+